MATDATTITALFDEQVLRPDEPLDLEPNVRYKVTIQPEPIFKDAWDVLEHYAGTVDAPPDWSLEHDHYLYGSPKRYTNETGTET